MSSRKCIHCPEFVRDRSQSEYIGRCNKYGRMVIDCLCGCEENGKKIILWNFTKERMK